MYPPAPAAKPSIDFDGRGFLIDGQRTYVASGSLHYARVPHELWHDRLLRFQRANFNCVETYAFWNFHEARENEFDFTGDKDLSGFLQTAQRLGLYSIVRVGPYVCAEWDSGGYPVWLRFKPPMRVRTDDPGFLAINDHWYGKILPLVAARQIHRGGNVIMVQLENEHPQGWGVVNDSPYFKHLEQKAAELGIEVPHFMSGLHHGSGPKPDVRMSGPRTVPWFTTEFWSGWFDLYGPLNNKRLRAVETDNWSILARGGGGHNFYMLHGGTNFDTWNDPSGAASYDYGAAIGQDGDLRPIYYRMKRANQVAASFPGILADGTDAMDDYQDFVTGAQLAGARRSPVGTLVFLHNPAAAEAVARLKDGSSLTMESSETLALPQDAVVAPGWKIASSTARVLAVAQQGDTVTVVTYGKPGDTGKIAFDAGKPLRLTGTSEGLSAGLAEPLHPVVTVKFPAGLPAFCTLSDGARRLRVVALSSDLSLYTWLVGTKGEQSLVIGPSYVSEFEEKAGSPTLLIERPYGQPGCGQVIVCGGGEAPLHLAVKADLASDAAAAPALSAWRMTTAREAAPDFDDGGWKTSDDPLQMGADGDNGAFAWYRTVITAPVAGRGTLNMQGATNLNVYVNGRLAEGKHERDRWTVEVPLTAGKNTLAVFASHNGRDKAFNYLGALSDYHSKGLFGPVTLRFDGSDQPVKNWRMHGGVDPAAFAAPETPAAGPANGIPALYRTTFQTHLPGETGAHPIYRATYDGLSRGTMWLNGHNLGRYPEKIRVNSLYLPECWLLEGQNTLTVFDECGNNPANVRLQTDAAASHEVIRVDAPGDAATPMVVSREDSDEAIAKRNAGNLAFGHPAVASSFKPNRPASSATDGDDESLWCASSGQTGEWLSVDLGAATGVAACEIVWEHRALAYEYVVEGSADGQSWTRLGDHTTAVPQSPDSPSRLSHVTFPSRPLRHVRVTVTGGLSDQNWASIGELRVFKE